MCIAASRSRLSTQVFSVVEVTPLRDVLVTETVLETLPKLSSACVILCSQDIKGVSVIKVGRGGETEKHQWSCE